MKLFSPKLTSLFWLKAVKKLLQANRPTRLARKIRSVRLGVEQMEDRITPTQIAQFSFAANNDYTNSVSGGTDTFGTTASGSSGLFQYQNIANLPSFLSGALNAHLVLTMSTTTHATQTSGAINQPFTGSETVQVLLNTPLPVGEGSGSRDNLISATFTGNLTSVAGQNSATLNSASVTFTSDFLDFSNTTNDAFSEGFTNVTPVTSIVNNFINSFTAAGSANFSTTPVAPLIGADLAITKTGPSTVAAGSSITYTVSVQNNGPVAAPNPIWTDSLPAGETLVSVTQTGSGSYSGPSWTNTGSGNTIHEVASGPLDPETGNGDNTVVFTIVASVSIAAYGKLTNTGVVAESSSDTTIGDPNPSNNTSSVVTTVTTNPTLTIVKSASDSTDATGAADVAGDPITYTLTVMNTSSQTATHVTVSDPLPAGETYSSQSQGSGPSFTLGHTGNTIDDTIAALAPGASQTFTVVAAVPADTSSGTQFTNTASVAWNGNGDANPGSANSPPVTTTIGTSADLSIVKTGPSGVLPGGNITYQLTVKNNGPSDAQNVQVQDPLPAATTFVSDSGASGWNSNDPSMGANGTVNETISTLASGASATFTIVVHNATGAAGTNISNTATIGSSTPDPNSNNNSSTSVVPVDIPASISGSVFEDFNDDGIENGVDAGLSGVTVTLTGPSGSSTTTLADGSYHFSNLVPGTYSLSESGPLGSLVQGKVSLGAGATSAGTLGSPAPYTPQMSGIVLSGGDNAVNYNFAAIPTATVQGIVFDNTAENDGVLHPGDAGLNGVTVTLTGTDDEGNPVNQSLSTTNIAGQAGSFAFTGLRPSNASGYTLTETQPNGYVQGQFDTVGSPLFGGSAAQSATQDLVTGIMVGDGANVDHSPVVSQNYLFPEIKGAQLSGLVYSDVNDDGMFDGGDAGINGVTVKLTGVDDRGDSISVTAITTTVSGQPGVYSFSDLRPSNAAGYTITETQPALYLEGTDNLGTLGGDGSVQDVFSAIPVGVAASGANYDFGEIAPAQLSGHVYVDVNDDGSFDAGDSGISGVTITLTGTDDRGNPVNVATTTAATGAYSFTNLRPPQGGTTYTLTETQPTGYLEGSDTSGSLGGNIAVQDVISAIPITTNANGTGYNFGELQSASLSGVVFDNSVEDNGLFNSSTDPGINGVTITLTGTDDQGDSVNVSTTTATVGGQAGYYSFTGLRPSNASGYTITDTNSGLPTNFLVGPNQNTGSLGGTLASPFAKTVSAITVKNSQTGVSYNFGEIQPDTLSGVVYVDANHSGAFVPGDTGLNGVQITLSGTNDLGAPITLYATTSTTAGQAGTYSFVGLRPSNAAGYTITESQPSTFNQGTDTIGTPYGGNAPSQTSTSDTVAGVVIHVGDANGVNYNFGELGAAISGSVFDDTDNNDGLRENGEPGINGVTITLTGKDSAGNPVNLTTTTNGTAPNDGVFSFQNLPASATPGYTLTETQPSGYLEGQDNAGTLGGNTVVQDVISRINVSSGASGVNYTFGELDASSLSGVVFDNSAEHDGTFHSLTDPGVNGATVTLTGTDVTGNAVNLTTTTATVAGQPGVYSFANLQPSNASGYTITETQPSSYLEGKDQLGSLGGSAAVQDVFSGIVVGYGASGVHYNFGELKPVTVSGVVFDNSKEDDGHFHPATDPGLNGVTIKLTGTDVNGNAVSLTTTTSTLLGQAGSYSFAGLQPSNAAGYTVTETQPAGYLEGGDQLGTLGGNAATQDVFSAISTTYGSIAAGYNFGELQPATLSGFVYIDANMNGVKDVNEPGIANVTVTLTGTNDLNQSVDVAVQTQSDGSFSFTGLRPSNASGYTLTETQPAGFLEGADAAGSLGGNISVQDVISQIPVAAGSTGTNSLFGEKAFASLSGFVYVDNNNNGVKEPGEGPVVGVTVTLTGTNILGNSVSLTSTTNALGAYSFANLLPSTAAGYTVSEPQPSQYANGKDSIGTGASVAGSQTQHGNPNILSGIVLAANNAAINYNFAEIGGSVSGTVFIDSNDNGNLDGGEPGLGGVTVTLFTSTGVPVGTTITASNGTYSFTGLPGGGYTIVETRPNGYGFSSPTTLTNLSLPVAGSLIGENFGNTLGSISGLVYVDVNNNGTRDLGEPPVSGAAITLTGVDSNGVAVNRTVSTDLEGAFAISNLLAGTYQLSEAQPAGYTNGKNTVGSVGGVQTTQNANPSIIGALNLPAGDNAVNYLFAEIGTVLSGKVFIDQNDSGVLTASDAGKAGVHLSLLNSQGSIQAITNTAPDGSYSFSGLTPNATYSVMEAVPNGYGASTPTELASLTVPAGGLSGENFGLTLGSLAGVVYVDAKNTGAFAATDPGIPGVTVALTGADASGAAVNLTTTTAGNGSYSFANLVGGSYTIAETQPVGFNEGKDTAGSLGGNISVKDVTSAITLGGGQVGVNYNFGEVNPAGLTSLSGTVFLDANDNGKLDAGETGSGGVTITLTGPVTKTTTSAANGAYRFASLPAGTYTVTETVPSGLNATSPLVLSRVTVAAPGVTGENFGLASGSLSGTVYVDSNDNGVLDGGEPGIPGVTITLNGPANATTTTGPNGTYSFANLPAGAYTLTETQPSGYAAGKDSAGSLGGSTAVQNAISSIALGVGAQGVGYNFAELTSGLSGAVYVDLNSDGQRQSGEPGIPGVTITITGPVTRSTLTAFNGTFSFSDLLPGAYTLSETQPSGYVTTKNAVGASGGTLATPSTDTITSINLPAGNVASGYLFGENAPIIAGNVYLDANVDGMFDTGDTGIGGDVVTLTDNTTNTVAATTSTGKDGSYLFTVPTPGDSYTITETQPVGYGSKERSSDVDSLGAVSASVLNQNFGKILGSISGAVYGDQNINGTQDTGETGIPGVALTLTGTDANGNPVSLSTVTDANGNFTFTGLLTPTGGYTITQTVPPSDYAGLAGTVGTSGAATNTSTRFTGIALGAGVNATGYKFGDILPADPFGYVYIDANHNGLKDTGETGIPGVKITISGVAFAGTPLARPLVASDDPTATPLVRTTNASGLYEFLTLPPGVYSITETPPAGYIGGALQNADPLTPPARPAVTTTTGAAPAFGDIQLVSGDVRGAFNFAELPGDALTGKVFLDMNANGVYDAGDVLKAGVTVTLSGVNEFGNPLNLATTTNASGVYVFNNLLPSNAAGYKIAMTTPAGYITGRAFIGSLGGTLSAGNVGPTTVLFSNTVTDDGVGYDFSLLPAGKHRLIG
jgi:uncharacterized repeat protein (TIGR01451 family)